MPRFHLAKEDSADIGFATDCLVAGIITFLEFKSWLYYVIENSEEVPSYFFDILDVEEKFDYTLRTVEILGFHPGWEATDNELNALDGIGFKRFSEFKTDAAQKETALQALEKNPHIEQRFREMFPFIDW